MLRKIAYGFLNTHTHTLGSTHMNGEWMELDLVVGVGGGVCDMPSYKQTS